MSSGVRDPAQTADLQHLTSQASISQTFQRSERLPTISWVCTDAPELQPLLAALKACVPGCTSAMATLRVTGEDASELP